MYASMDNYPPPYLFMQTINMPYMYVLFFAELPIDQLKGDSHKSSSVEHDILLNIHLKNLAGRWKRVIKMPTV